MNKTDQELDYFLLACEALTHIVERLEQYGIEVNPLVLDSIDAPGSVEFYQDFSLPQYQYEPVLSSMKDAAYALVYEISPNRELTFKECSRSYSGTYGVANYAGVSAKISYLGFDFRDGYTFRLAIQVV